MSEMPSEEISAEIVEEGSDIPDLEPTASGSEGGQETAPVEPTGIIVLATNKVNPYDQRHLGAALHSSADTRSPVVMRMAVAAFTDSLETKAALAEENHRLRITEEGVRLDYHRERERRLSLQTEVRMLRQSRRSQQIAMVTGSVTAGTGLAIAVAQSSLMNVGGLLIGLGTIFIYIGASLPSVARSSSTEGDHE